MDNYAAILCIMYARETAAWLCFLRPSAVPPSMAVRKILTKNNGVPMALQMVLRLPQGHQDSEYVLGFPIGQREGGFYNVRTDTQMDRHTEYRISI